ncbi:MAG: glutathione S-transferase family protein [Gammaproteobacteria bacterium]|nr:glutathione S-transferase family protein [Gammaproteobacteria bacterium]
MKLLYTGNSPYARRARVAIIEAGLSDRIQQIDIEPRDENIQQLLDHNPSGKVPLLVLDEGGGLCESLLICHYLDELSGGRLYPKDGARRLAALELEGVASALMDSLFVRARENRRDESERSLGVIQLETVRADRCYDALQLLIGAGDDIDHMGGYAAVCALGYADWRHPGDDWRDGRQSLHGWYDRMMERPSLAQTKPVF